LVIIFGGAAHFFPTINALDVRFFCGGVEGAGLETTAFLGIVFFTESVTLDFGTADGGVRFGVGSGINLVEAGLVPKKFDFGVDFNGGLALIFVFGLDIGLFTAGLGATFA